MVRRLHPHTQLRNGPASGENKDVVTGTGERRDASVNTYKKEQQKRTKQNSSNQEKRTSELAARRLGKKEGSKRLAIGKRRELEERKKPTRGKNARSPRRRGPRK